MKVFLIFFLKWKGLLCHHDIAIYRQLSLKNDVFTYLRVLKLIKKVDYDVVRGYSWWFCYKTLPSYVDYMHIIRLKSDRKKNRIDRKSNEFLSLMVLRQLKYLRVFTCKYAFHFMFCLMWSNWETKSYLNLLNSYHYFLHWDL